MLQNYGWMNSRQVVHSMFLATAAVLVLSVALMWFRTVPIISADEIGYLGNARWLATGVGPSMGYTVFYSGGYSLLVAPFEWLLHDPRSVYKAVMVINALFVASTVLALVRIARDFGFSPDTTTPWLAAAVALWPAQFVQAYLALPEIAVRLCFLLMIVATFALMREGGWRHAVSVATLAIISFALHPRMVMIIPLCLIIVLVARWRGQIGWGPASASIALVGMGYFAVDVLNKVLQEALWVTRQTPADVLRTIISGVVADPTALLARIFGHFWYQVASSLLMIPLGAIMAIRWILADSEPAKRFTAAFILVATGAVGVLGAANLLNVDTLDVVVYGRFLDVVTPALFWFGVLGVTSVAWRASLTSWAPWAAAASIVGGSILFFVYSGISGRGVNIIEIGAFAPIYRALPPGDDALRLFVIAPVVSAATGMVLFAVGAQSWRLLIVLGVVVAVAMTTIKLLYRDANSSLEASTAAAANVYVRANGGVIHLDRSTVGGHVYIHQYMLKMHFPAIDVVAEPLRTSGVAIVGPSAIGSVSGECLGAIDQRNRLVRLGEGDPTNCP